MKILIGNQIDDSIRVSSDTSAAAQRILWFAEDHDIVVLPAAPDPDYMAYVTGLTGTDLDSLQVFVPPGAYEGKLLDPLGLSAPGFLSSVASMLDSSMVTEVFPLWPSASVARFADALGVWNALPGAEFALQGGGEPINSKAVFRSLAAGAGVTAAEGTVCLARSEAALALAAQITRTGSAVVKQAHNGSGNGNHIVFGRNAGDTGHAGARHVSVLDGDFGSIERFWEEHWDWASAEGRFPVVIEAYLPGAVSVYVEYRTTDDSVIHTGSGVLEYAERSLDMQQVPLRPTDIGSEPYKSLLLQGERLAQTYRATGYRGYLSADALVDSRGHVSFTEVNAQVSGSLHLYGPIAQQLVRADEVPERTVAEYDLPMEWGVSGVADFVEGARAAGCLYDPSTRLGAVVSTAPQVISGNRMTFMFCLAFDNFTRRDDMRQRLARHFSAREPVDQHIKGK